MDLTRRQILKLLGTAVIAGFIPLPERVPALKAQKSASLYRAVPFQLGDATGWFHYKRMKNHNLIYYIGIDNRSNYGVIQIGRVKPDSTLLQYAIGRESAIQWEVPSDEGIVVSKNEKLKITGQFFTEDFESPIGEKEEYEFTLDGLNEMKLEV